MKLMPVLIAACLTVPSVQAAQLYQWKDAAGNVHYSDQPPPPSIKNAQQKNFKGSFIEGNESYAMKRAREKSPVVLYVTNCGLPCDQARQHLAQRGIPYTTKNPESGEDRAALQKLTGRTNIPVLVVGSAKVDGYEAGQWDAALDAAGYPKFTDVKKKAASATNETPPTKTPGVSSPAPIPAPAAAPPPRY